MCLAVPGKIIEIKDKKSIIDYIDEKREADCSLIKCNPGEYVIVSNGMVIDKILEKEALESLKMYQDAVKEK